MDQWTDCCRSCLKRGESFSYFIYENIRPQQYFYCTSIEVKRDDKLPKAICDCCYNGIQQFIKFKTKCILSEKKLRTLSDGLSIKDEPPPDTKLERKGVNIEEQDIWNWKGESKGTGIGMCSDIKIEIEIEGVKAEAGLDLKTEEDDHNEDTGPVPEEDDHIITHSLPGPAPSSSILQNLLSGYATPPMWMQGDVSSQIPLEPGAFSNVSDEPQMDVLADIEDQAEATEGSIGQSTEKIVSTKITLARNFKCEMCSRKFSFKERFDAHMLSHEGKTAPIQCKTCHRTFNSWETLRRHIITHHSTCQEANVTCQICSKVCQSPKMLQRHLRAHERNPGARTCKECGKRCKNDVTYKIHLETHTQRERIFSCELCGKKFFGKRDLYTHQRHLHSDRKLICDYCGFASAHKANFIRHLRIHEGTQKYKCDMCIMTMNTQEALKRHRRMHSGEVLRPFPCGYCGKTYPRKSILKIHERVHTGERPYKCEFCENTFALNTSYKRHLKRHNKVEDAT